MTLRLVLRVDKMGTPFSYVAASLGADPQAYPEAIAAIVDARKVTVKWWRSVPPALWEAELNNKREFSPRTAAVGQTALVGLGMTAPPLFDRA